MLQVAYALAAGFCVRRAAERCAARLGGLRGRVAPAPGPARAHDRLGRLPPQGVLSFFKEIIRIRLDT